MKIQEKTILYTPFREGKLAQKLRKIVWSVCPKVNMEFLHEPAILLLVSLSELSVLPCSVIQSVIQSKYESIFISIYGKIKKRYRIYMRGYNSSTKMDEILSFAIT